MIILSFSDYERNFTNVNTAIEIAAAGPGVVRALWLLALALIFKVRFNEDVTKFHL